jgi:hypothetical protein
MVMTDLAHLCRSRTRLTPLPRRCATYWTEIRLIEFGTRPPTFLEDYRVP